MVLPAVNVPRRLQDQTIEPVTPSIDAAPLSHLMAGSAKPVPAIGIFHAGGREAEIEEVCRRILALGAPLDQVEIACASDAHVALVWEKAMRHDWPVTQSMRIGMNWPFSTLI